MGLFDKKTCDFCGKKIGLLGNKKLEDGNMCRDCALKLSPWFSDRRHSTRADIQAQLDYREANKAAVAAFRTTRSIGRYTKLLIDEDARKFMVTASGDPKSANPDVLDFSQATGCDLDVRESRSELRHADKDGRQVSYVPPRFEYSYNFQVTIHVDHPFFDEIAYSISNGYIKTGEQAMSTVPAGWNVHRMGQLPNFRLNEYNECMKIGYEIKEAVDAMHRDARAAAPASNTPPAPAPAAPAAAKGAVVCPFCTATTVPDENGCCEYCGSPLRG